MIGEADDDPQWNEALRWIAMADADIRAAEMLLQVADPLPGQAAFHGQQAAEKLAKALLVATALRAPRTHDITALAGQAKSAHPASAAGLARLGHLTDRYVAARYPDLDAVVEPTAAEVLDALRAIRTFRRELLTLRGP